MLKVAAVVANVCLLGMVTYLFAKQGVPHRTEDIVMSAVLVVAPVLALVALLGRRATQKPNDPLFRRLPPP